MGLSGMFFRLIMLLMKVLLITVATAALTPPQAKPAANCPTHCGKVEIPYPFGTKPDCYLNDNFLITCDYSYNPPKPFLRHSNIHVTNITDHGELHVKAIASKKCYDGSGDSESWLSLKEFTIPNKNKFTVIGCNSYAYVEGYIGEDQAYSTGCMSVCNSHKYVKDGSCDGQGCCQIAIPQGLKNINFTAYIFSNNRNVSDFNPCTYAFVVEQGQFIFSSSYLSELPNDSFPVTLDWSITRSNGACDKARTSPDYACKENADCYNPYNRTDGYLCKCNDGYKGNPYLPNGCQDIDECQDPKLNQCSPDHICTNEVGNHTCSCKEGYQGSGRKDDGEGCRDIDECHQDPNLNNCTHLCHNIPGSYDCSCPEGYSGDGQKDGKGCRRNIIPVVYKVVGIGVFLVVLLLIPWLYLVLNKRKLIRQRKKFFQQNGGFLLKQQLSIKSGSSDTAKIFTAEELKNATNNYAEDRIIGRGGYGTVYKGLLADNSPVAIKKSKVMNKGQVDQFVNEVVVLSQINHRNVVRLLGCCLETEVPLLVYEFVSNGTLYDHIHNKDRAARTICWETRLKIAAETAGVLSYLHSAASTPIIHRDVKTSNILLDHKFTAKVSDFGASKLVPMDVTQLSTMVQGTLGYLDPEYLHTSQLTEKSDVYSFGVVLVELLTGKKPILFDRPEEDRSLVMYFLSSLKESRLFEIMENHMVNDENKEQVREVAELAKRCLRVKGEERPPMMEVAMELEGLRIMHRHLSDKAEVFNPEETESLLYATLNAYESGNGSSTTGHDNCLIVDGR